MRKIIRGKMQFLGVQKNYLIDTVLLSSPQHKHRFGCSKNHLIMTVLKHMLWFRKNKINFQGLIMHWFGL